jgi:hypothetical protein
MDLETDDDKICYNSRFQILFFSDKTNKFKKKLRKCILQFDLKLIIAGSLWRCKEYFPQIVNLLIIVWLCLIHIQKSCFFLNLFETCSLHLCGLFYTWILKPEIRMAWIYMDSQTGNDKFWHFSRFQKLVYTFVVCLIFKHLCQHSGWAWYLWIQKKDKKDNSMLLYVYCL